MTPIERALLRVERTEGCWLWRGFINPKGYAQLSVRVDGRVVTYRVHRLMYEQFIGPIPDGVEPDHTCRNRACVNPAHLELVTHAVNMARAEAAAGIDNYNGRKTHCPAGHHYDEANTYRYRGRRHCRACRTERVAA